MSTLQEIEAAVPKLSAREVAELRAWLDDYLEDRLELNETVKSELEEARRDIAEGRVTVRRPS